MTSKIRVFGVANHSLEAAVQMMLKTRKVESSEVGVVQIGYELPKKPVHRFLLFLTTRDFGRNLEVLKTRRYENVTSLVFSNPISLSEIKGMCPLDFVQSPNYAGFGFTLTSFNASTFKTHKGSEVDDVRIVKTDCLKRLVTHVRQGSMLNPFMTVVYSLPSTSQNLVKQAVVSWLYHGKSVKALDASLREVLSTRMTQKIKDIVATDIGVSFQNAFATYRSLKKAGGACSIAEIAKKHSVSDYEMRYMLSVLDVSPTKYVDSFDKAKNRRKSIA